MQKYDPESDNENETPKVNEPPKTEIITEIIQEVKEKPIKEKKPRSEAQIKATQLMRERLKERQSQSKETVERIKIMNQEKNKEKEIMRNIIMEELEQISLNAAVISLNGFINAAFQIQGGFFNQFS